MVTLPSQQDFENEDVGPILAKYLKGRGDIPVEKRVRMLRLIENMTLGRNAVGYLTESLHGAGSPQAQRIQILRGMDVERKKRYAEKLADLASGSDDPFVAAEADVILAIGCRFADEAASSYVPGVTFSIPPTKLYQVDIDEYEIGKNYPVELGVMADANAFCEALWAEIGASPADTEKRAYWEGQIANLGLTWNKKLEPGRSELTLPLRMSAVPTSAIV